MTGPERRGVVDAAVAQLKRWSGPRAVEIGDAVLDLALRAPRRSEPVRAHPPHRHVQVSDTTLVSLLRHRVDAGLDVAAVGRVAMEVTRERILDELTVELFVQYGAVLMDVADEARVIVEEVLLDALGAADVAVRLTTTHVHVGDVTVGDPHVVDPRDE